MQSPKFLMGGIRASKNFLGTNTMKSFMYVVIENTFKLTPVFMIFLAMGRTNSNYKI